MSSIQEKSDGKVMPFRVWWIPQIPMKSFVVGVPDLQTASILLDTLAEYDKFQFDNNIKPDYCNVGGLLMLEDGVWVDWYNNDEDMEFDSYRVKYLKRTEFIDEIKG